MFQKKLAYEVVFWAAMIVLPFIGMTILMHALPDEVTQIPLHWDMSGQVDRWGSASELWLLPMIMGVVQLVLAFGYFRLERLHEYGMVHGVSPARGRVLMAFCAVVMVAVSWGITLAIYVSVSEVL